MAGLASPGAQPCSVRRPRYQRGPAGVRAQTASWPRSLTSASLSSACTVTGADDTEVYMCLLRCQKKNKKKKKTQIIKAEDKI